MGRTLKFLALGITAGMLSAGSVQAAQCVNVVLLDEHDTVIPVGHPLIGLMVGGVPAFDGEVPQHASRRAGAEVPCPEALVANVRELFEASCLTDERRTQAAAKNRADIAAINKGCTNMAKALSDKKEE